MIQLLISVINLIYTFSPYRRYSDDSNNAPPHTPTPRHFAGARADERTCLCGGHDAQYGYGHGHVRHGRYGRHDECLGAASRGRALRVHAAGDRRDGLPLRVAADDRDRPAQTAPADPRGGRRRLPEIHPRILRRAQGRHRRRSDDARHGRLTHDDADGRHEHGGRMSEPHGSDGDVRIPRDLQPHHREQGAAERALRREHRGQRRL